jgi:CSLREA domain-containing protein/uncharacterized repeat protein (TIGR01451 family)
MKAALAALALFFFATANAATITVTSAADNTIVDGQCTLREAIIAANSNSTTGDCTAGTAGLDTIHFAIGSGTQTINLASALPAITEPLTIDATTQPGYSGTPLIDVNGSAAGTSVGLTLVASGNAVTGLAIDHFALEGIRVASSNNVISSNRIAFNGSASTVGAGVRVLSGTGNRISMNSMSFNSGLSGAVAIDLGTDGATPNDSCDSDTGPNNLQNSPVLTAAVVSGGTTTVTGTLNSTASSTFTLEFFSSAPASFDQGTTSLGSTTVTTSSGCTTSFTVQLPSVPTSPVPFSITATATDSANDTSEMSAARFAAPALTATKSFNPASIHAGETSTLTLTITNSDTGTVSALAVSDTYPAGLVNAAGTPSTTCGGSLTATPGSGSFTLSGGALGALASCQITVPVTAAAAAAYTNTIPTGGISGSYTFPTSITTPTANAAPVSAGVTVALFPPPGVTKSFAPTTVGVNQTSRMTIRLTNGNSSAIIGAAFSDALPSGLAVAAIPNVANTCGGTLSANGGTVALSGGTIPAGGSCTVAVDVVASAFGTFTNTIQAGAVTSANAQPNSAPASASILVSANIPALTPLGIVLLLSALAALAIPRLRG